jgi:tetratricopeptide (TPR) repeat protein
LNAKNRGVLAYLGTVAGSTGAVPRETLRRLLWPDVPERKGRHSLTQSIYALNKALPGWLESDSQHVRLRVERGVIDVNYARYIAVNGPLQVLPELLGGSFLADVSTDAEEFEDWKDSMNFDFYRDIEVKACEALRACQLTTPQTGHEIALRLAEKIVGSKLVRETERSLYSRTEAKQSAALVTTSNSTLNLATPFLGRHHELNKLAETWNEALQGKGSLAAVTGVAGSGKTRVLDEFLHRQAADALVIRVRCYEPEMHIGLNIAADLVEQILTPQIRSVLPPVYSSALSEIASGFNQERPSTPLPTLSENGSQRRLFEAMSQAIILQSQSRAIVFVIDDVHWSDDSTIAFLHFLSRRVTSSPVMILAAARPSKRVKTLIKAPTVVHVKLTELTAADMEPLRSELTSAQHKTTIQQLIRLTGGNPFLIDEYLKYPKQGHDSSRLRHPLSSTNVRDFVRNLVGSLPASAKWLLGALAVVGRPIRASLLQQIANYDAVAFATAFAQLQSRRIVIDDPELWFRHDLVRDVLYKALRKEQRRVLHSRVAQALARAEYPHDALAMHYYHAEQYGESHSHAVAAAESAKRRAATNEMIFYLRLAIRTTTDKKVRERIRYDLIHRYHRLGKYVPAIRNCEHALRTGSPLPMAKKARIFLIQIDSLVMLGRLHSGELLTHLIRLDSEFGPLDDDTRYEALKVRIRSLAIDGDASGCAGLVDDLTTLAGRLTGDRRALALSYTARMSSWAQTYQTGMKWAVEAEQSLLCEDLEATADVYGNIAGVYYDAGEYSRSLELFNTSLEYIVRAGAMQIWPRTATNKLAVLVDIGRFDEARLLADEVLAKWSDADSPQHLATMYGNLAIIDFYLQDIHRMRDHAQYSLTWATSGMSAHRVSSGALLGMAALEEGKIEEASDYAQLISDEVGARQRAGDFSWQEIFLARLRLRRGQLREALEGARTAADECRNKDVGGWLRLQLEVARILRRTKPAEAKTLADSVKQYARRIGARPLEEAASGLLFRL